jgi:HEAT repeat protein
LEQAVRDLSHGDPAVRRNALERIAWMGAEAEEAAVDVTLCLADPHLEIRAYAAKTLWDVDKQSALAAVNTLKELVDSTQPGIRSLASFYLGYIGPEASSALPVLKRALANTESTEQLQIAEAIASESARKIPMP